MGQREKDENIDQNVIDGFGHEWAAFNYTETETAEALDAQFAAYCAPLDLTQFNPETSVAGDFGAGSGRWSSRLAPYFSRVYALEPSDGASTVLKRKDVRLLRYQYKSRTVLKICAHRNSSLQHMECRTFYMIQTYFQ